MYVCCHLTIIVLLVVIVYFDRLEAMISESVNVPSKQCSAVIPYLEPSILRAFHDTSRSVSINGHHYTFIQKWNDNGVSGVLWDSAVVLANYIASHAELVIGRSVLELGAGLGLPSIVAAEVGARSVDATDQQLAIPLLAENVRRNCPSDASINVFPLNWQTDRPKHPYEVVLGADLVYKAELFKPLAEVMKRSRDNSTLFLFSNRIRYLKDELFYRTLKEQGFIVSKEFYDSSFDVHIFRITAANLEKL
uniref:Protein N-lysine methyltransferase METTL21A n=1 Tax=Parascaris univalens TaxID=6257 RepID=A0A915AHS3_PARUN